MSVDPRTESVDTGSGRLVYQVVDSPGPGVILWCQELQVHLDLFWTDPSIAGEIEALAAAGATSILCQERGVGLSDPVARLATIEESAADLLAVLDAEGVERATLVGTLSRGLAAMLLAAQHPERVTAVILCGTIIAGARVTDSEYGWTPETSRACIEDHERLKGQWGTGQSLRLLEPGLATPHNVRLWAMTERCCAAPAFVAQAIDRWLDLDARALAPQVPVPLWALGARGWPFPLEAARALAEAAPRGIYREIPAVVLGDSLATAAMPVFQLAGEVVLGPAAAPPRGVLASVLFLDIVRSTEHLARVGDSAWKAVLERFDVLTRREVARGEGEIVKSTGDGALCAFGSAAAAVDAARALCEAAPELGIEVRAGVHSGECVRVPGDLAGIALHVAARVCDEAAGGEVLVTRAVRDLIAGAGVEFAPRGARTLRGVSEPVEMFAAGGTRPLPAAPLVPEPNAMDRAIVGLARRAPGAIRTLNRAGSAVRRGALRRRKAPARRG